jgi:hypothetical protein
MLHVGSAGAGETSKARDRWMQYIKMLKPLSGKVPPHLYDVKMDNTMFVHHQLQQQQLLMAPFFFPEEQQAVCLSLSQQQIRKSCQYYLRNPCPEA